MAFELKSVVPWGRSLDEYRMMFNLTEETLRKRIISFGDGPASFNAQMKRLGYRVVSLDPIYGVPKQALHQRILETKDEVLAQTRNNRENFVWKHIRDVAELEKVRMGAMERFLADYESGKREGRYVPHALPTPTSYQDDAFALGLSSHFLVLYAKLGLDFHLQSIEEMLRVCREIRIFPLLDLDGGESGVLEGIIDFFSQRYHVVIEPVDYEFQCHGNKRYHVVIEPVDYEFQCHGNKMLRITKTRKE